MCMNSDEVVRVKSPFTFAHFNMTHPVQKLEDLIDNTSTNNLQPEVHIKNNHYSGVPTTTIT
jgi:hypothetical protein